MKLNFLILDFNQIEHMRNSFVYLYNNILFMKGANNSGVVHNGVDELNGVQLKCVGCNLAC